MPDNYKCPTIFVLLPLADIGESDRNLALYKFAERLCFNGFKSSSHPEQSVVWLLPRISGGSNLFGEPRVFRFSWQPHHV